MEIIFYSAIATRKSQNVENTDPNKRSNLNCTALLHNQAAWFTFNQKTIDNPTNDRISDYN